MQDKNKKILKILKIAREKKRYTQHFYTSSFLQKATSSRLIILIKFILEQNCLQ